MSFFRHGQIYQSDGRFVEAANKPGATLAAAPGAHRLDEFATGYSLAGCSPADNLQGLRPRWMILASDEPEVSVFRIRGGDSFEGARA